MVAELLIVGAGPAGVSAALWAHSLGLDVAVIESAPGPGGQLQQVHFEPRNFAGAAALDGPALAQRLGEQLVASRIGVRYDAVAIALHSSEPELELSNGERLAAAAILIATGARRRRLEVPGEREFEGRGVSTSATQDRGAFAGEDVVVVGGGDAAFENALLLSDVGCRVTIVVRETPRARVEFRDRVEADPSIEVIEHARVTGVVGSARVERVAIESAQGRFELPAAGLVVKVGVQPNTEWCHAAIATDDAGYIVTDDRLVTSHSRAWAAGDVVGPPLLGLSVATGQGALAVASIRATLREL